MMDRIIRQERFFFVILGVFLPFALAANLNNTADEDINGQYLLDMGRRTDDHTLQAIGMAIKNLRHQGCDDWTSWTSCTAISPSYFGIKGRTRVCRNDSSTVNVKPKTTEIRICRGFCPPDYVKTANGFCLKLHVSRKTVAEAAKQCKTEGGYLVNIESQVKYEDIKNLTMSIKSSYIHIGGRRNDTNSPWKFEYGRQTGFFKWDSREPTNTLIELCLCLNGSNKLMHDQGCSNLYNFICEIIV